MPEKIDGSGFSEKEFAPHERAEIRALKHDIENDDTRGTLKSFAAVLKGAKIVVIIAGAGVTLGAFISGVLAPVTEWFK